MGNKSFFNNIFKAVTAMAAAMTVVVVLGMFVTLIGESFPAIREFGLIKFIFSTSWNFTEHIYGGGRPLLGTLITTGIALTFAVPIALGIAIFLTEICPHKLRTTLGTAIELLAAIPSIIYGMWGLFVLAPFLERTAQPALGHTLGKLPLIGSFFQSDYAGGINIFTASVILAIMVIPYIASISRDAFNQVAPMLKESAYGIGATKWEAVKDVVLPYTKYSVTGGIIIAMGRALGETMAVAYVIGNRHGALESIFSPFTTITSVLANEFNEASGLQLSSLFMLALILLAANFLVLTASKIVLRPKL